MYTVFFGEIHEFLKLIWKGLFGANRNYLHIETLKMQEYCFIKLTQFSQGNNVQDAPVPNKVDFLLRQTWVSVTQENRPIWNKMNLSPP
jgi:hypothetical protein